MDTFLVMLLMLVGGCAAVGFGGLGYLTGRSRDTTVSGFVAIPIGLGLIGLVVMIITGPHSSWIGFGWMFIWWVAGVALGRLTRN